MAYRFNPPPNWPIDDANWSPPPGWQPDPSWGPAPDGWNFWIASEQAPAPQPEQAPEHPVASGDDDATHVASSGEQASAQDQSPAGQYGSLNPYGQGPAQDAPAQNAGQSDLGASAPVADDQSASAPAEAAGRHAAEPVVAAVQDDATHVADSGQRDSITPEAGGSQPAQPEGTSETAEYEGPDLEADLAQQTPYESAEPVATDDSSQFGDSSQDAGYGMAAGAAAAGGVAGAAAAPQQSQPNPSGQGYGQGSPVHGYGQGSPSQGYGQQSAAQGYGQDSSAPAYGQASPAAGYGDGSAAPTYGQGSPAQGYGQASPAQGYGQGSAPEYPGQGSASDYSAPGYSQNSPGIDTGAGWTASTGAGEPPKKGIIRRFWWIGCLIAIVLVLALIAIGGIFLFNRSSGPMAGGEDPTTTQEEGTTEEGDPTTEEPTEEETTPDEPAEEETTADEIPIPTDLSTIDPAAEAEAINIVGLDGTGTMAVHMAYAPASDLESSYGGTVDEAQYGEYVVLTAKMTVTEGELSLNPFQFDIQTPYGGAVEPATASFGLKGSGTDGPMDFQAGEEYTIKIIFDVQRAGGNKLVFNSYADEYSWDVPA